MDSIMLMLTNCYIGQDMLILTQPCDKSEFDRQDWAVAPYNIET